MFSGKKKIIIVDIEIHIDIDAYKSKEPVKTVVVGKRKNFKVIPLGSSSINGS